ncbi:MAG: prepilin peptidase [Candidatus Weimeria sp.]
MREMYLAAYLAAATAADLKWQRIPNELILFGILTGLFLRAESGGVKGMIGGILSGVIILAAFYIFYMIGAVGAGDVKLLAVTGLVAGSAFAAYTALYSLFAAGAAALFFILIKRQTHIRMYLLYSHIALCIRQKKIIRYSALEQEGYLHYALYISIGFLTALTLGKEFG